MDDVMQLSMDELRCERRAARRDLELALMRSRPVDRDTDPVIGSLRATVRELTDELIRRYASDLDLVDDLLVSGTRAAPQRRAVPA